MTRYLLAPCALGVPRRDYPSCDDRFNTLIVRHIADLYRYARMLCGDDANAQDLVQETLLRAWKSFDKLQEAASAKAWLIRILRRENARRYSRCGRFPPDRGGSSLEHLGDPHTAYDTSVEAFLLRRAMGQLDPGYRAPLLMQVIYGYSLKAISRHLGITAADAGTRLFRARKKIRALLHGYDQDHQVRQGL